MGNHREFESHHIYQLHVIILLIIGCNMTNFNRYDWDDREQVLLDLKISTSMSDFLINIGLGSNPGNCHTFKRKIQMHNIDLTNIYQARVRKALSKIRVNKQKLSHDEIFSESSPCSREYVKAVIKKHKHMALKTSKYYYSIPD